MNESSQLDVLTVYSSCIYLQSVWMNTLIFMCCSERRSLSLCGIKEISKKLLENLC